MKKHEITIQQIDNNSILLVNGEPITKLHNVTVSTDTNGNVVTTAQLSIACTTLEMSSSIITPTIEPHQKCGDTENITIPIPLEDVKEWFNIARELGILKMLVEFELSEKIKQINEKRNGKI